MQLLTKSKGIFNSRVICTEADNCIGRDFISQELVINYIVFDSSYINRHWI